MKHPVLFLLCVLTTAVFAQPVINSNVIPGIGHTAYSYKSNTANSFNLGASGANVTWNYATLDTALGSSSQKTVRADTTYYYSDYPSVVNQAVGGWTGLGPVYAYTYLDNSKYEYYGMRSFAEHKVYIDPQRQLTFPFTYNNQFTDTFYDDFPVYYGRVTVKADAYGTLILPTGIFSNVLRVKVNEIYRQYDEDMPDDSLFYEGTYYRWYQPNTTGILLEYGKLVSFYIYQGARYDFDSLKHVVFRKGAGVTAIDEAEASFSSKVYPNPAGNVLMINNEVEVEKIEVTDLCGKVVLQQNFFDKNITLNLENLAAGTYYLQLTTADNRRKTLRVLHY